MKRLACALAGAAFTLLAGHESARAEERTANPQPQEQGLGPPSFGGRSVYTQGRKLRPCTLYSCGRDFQFEAKPRRAGAPARL